MIDDTVAVIVFLQIALFPVLARVCDSDGESDGKAHVNHHQSL